MPAHAAALVAGFLQGLHTALHGFGLLSLASGALAALSKPGDALRRALRAATFTSAGVSLYLGWIFFYVTLGRLSLIWERELGHRPFFESIVFENKLATPLFSQAGFGEFGLFSALSGVPLLALALLSSRRAASSPRPCTRSRGCSLLCGGGRRARRSTSISCCRSSPVSLPPAG